MKRAVFVYILIALLTLSVIGAMAQGRGKMARMNQPANQPMMCRDVLGLTPAQIGEMDRLRAAFMKDTDPLRADLQARQQEIMKLWAATEPNARQIKAKAAEADRIASQIRDRAIDLHASMLGVLAPDQRAKCAQCCQSGQCGMGCGLGMGCPMAGGRGMGMGMGPNGAGMCTGAGCGMAPRGGMGMGPNGTGCPLAR